MSTRPERKLSKDGSPHVTDEKINTISHLAAAIIALMGAVLLIVKASVAGTIWQVVGFSVYAVGLVGLFVASALHHGINASETIEQRLRMIDYLAIFLLIAGTYTPICLVLARDSMGWTVFGVTWAVAIIGIVMKVLRPDIPKRVTMTFYVTLGWLAVLLAWPIFQKTGGTGVAMMAAGGIFYTVGGVFYVRERPNPVPGFFGFHEIWHLMVILGAASHYLFMYAFVLPLK